MKQSEKLIGQADVLIPLLGLVLLFSGLACRHDWAMEALELLTSEL